MAVDLSIKYWPTAKLIPYAKNARLHSDDQVAAIAKSIAEFGFVNPVLVDAEGEIVAGHGRTLAAKLLGLDRVPVIQLGHLSEEQVRAYRLADNRLAETGGGWDIALVRAELEDLGRLGFDIGLTAFDLADFGGRPGKSDPDEAPPRPAKPDTRAGDLYVLGPHRLLCGDATAATDVARLLGGEAPVMMVTDPPYGVNYDPGWRDEMGIDWTGQVQRKSTHKDLKPLKSRSLGKVVNDDRADWSEAWALFPGDVAYVWHGGLHAAEVEQSLIKSGFAMRAQIVWAKQHFVFSRGDYHWQHEPCWYAVRKGGKARWSGDRKQTTVWNIANASAFKGDKGEANDSITGHGTQKPVECMARPIRNNSRKGEAIYDPFLGSGTTVIAAEVNGRRCLGMEVDPGYCDVVVARWEKFTGGKAIREREGRPVARAASKAAGKSTRRGRSSASPSPSPS